MGGVVVYNLDRLARKLTVQEGVLATVWDRGGSVFSLGDGGEVQQDDPDDPMRTAMRQMRARSPSSSEGLSPSG